MQRFVREVIGFGLIQAVVLVWVLSQGGSDRNGYISALIDKHSRFSKTVAPRIVFVGGSAMAFSLDSKAVEQGLGRPVVNMGLHAGLGLDYILADVPMEQLKPGDLVVLNLEYEHFSADHTMVDILFEALRTRPISWLNLSPSTLKRLLDDGLALPTTYLNSRLAAFRKGHGPATGESIYRRSGFDAYGDVVAHLDVAHPQESVRQHIESRQPLKLPDAYVTGVIHRLNRFADQCSRRGVAVVLVYPAYPEVLLQRNEAAIAELDRKLRNHLRFTLLGRPQDGAAPVDYFYDTHYHLNREGIHWRTAGVLANLQQRLHSAAISEPPTGRAIGQWAQPGQ